MLKPSTEGAAALVWAESSYSSNDGPDCVEVGCRLRLGPHSRLQGHAGPAARRRPRHLGRLRVVRRDALTHSFVPLPRRGGGPVVWKSTSGFGEQISGPP